MLSSHNSSFRSVLTVSPRVGFLLLLVAVMAFFPFSGQFVEADAASTSFNPTQVSLLAIGESATITVETVDVDADASGVQINVQHSANLAVSNPACVGIFSAADFLIGPSTVDGGTLFGCAFLSETVSDTTGDVMTYTLTRVGDFDEEKITFLAGGPQGLGFSVKGISKGPGEINRLSVIGFLRDDPPMVNNNTESVSVGDLPDESYVRSPINSSETSEIVTPDARVQVTVPQGALPANVGGAVEIEVKNIEVSITPDAPDNAVIVRAIELNTLVNGAVTPTDYLEPVELVFILIEADLALVNGDTSRLVVLWFNTETGAWEPIDANYDSNPAPAGSLVALLDHFSVYAIGVTEPEKPQVTEATATPVSTTTPAPEPATTAVPVTAPAPTAGLVVTSAPATAATPTAIVVAQAEPTPVATSVSEPTTTTVPLAPAIPAAPAPPSQPSAEPPEPPPLAEVPGGIGTTTIVILIIVGIAVLAGIGVVAQNLIVRRREA